MNTKVSVIEVTGVKLDPKAKYIIALHPIYGNFLGSINAELARLKIAATVIPIEPDKMKIWEVMPGTTSPTKETTQEKE